MSKTITNKDQRISELIYWWKKDGFLYRDLANELIDLLVQDYDYDRQSYIGDNV